METRAHHVVIGLFTLLALAGGLLFALWMTQSTGDREFIHYEVFFDRSVSGLAEGNAVEYSGVRVGEVTDLRLDPQDPRNVLAQIRVEQRVPIRHDTRARLALANITGSMSIQLHGGTPESPLLIAAPEAPPPRIIADPSPLSALLGDGEEILGNVNRVLDRLEALLSEENTDSIQNILANLERTTASLARVGDAPSRLVSQMESLSAEGVEALEEIRTFIERAGGMLGGQGEEIMDGARQTTASLARTAEQMENLLGANQGALESGIRGIEGLGPATVELRNTLNTLNRVIRRLEDNPTDFLLGRDNVEEFTP
ncbi:MlaD family protein [Halomonas chromatireducens]|uniref:Paraquat-inducible protein B n=1 Tax=Halomonas chromatireducens TaxID=507626 RepID=A0A0X8HCX5_9GAMM|nr:MlaD family protein [Halomonas chromatireducens]AMD00200.1 paraquat-inducible protein B [Halomonas chromatireducens]